MDWQGVLGSKCTDKTTLRTWEDHLVEVEKVVKVFKELGCNIAESNVNMQEIMSP